MNNIEELRNELSNVFIQLKNGDIKAKEASELANVAGKMINSAKVQLEYYIARKEMPEIKFLKNI